jgi:hypothetical protein
VWFFDFPKNHRFQVFQNNQNQRTGWLQVFSKNQNQSTSQFRIFQKPMVLSRFFPGSLILKLFSWSALGAGNKNILFDGWILVGHTRTIILAGSVLGARV